MEERILKIITELDKDFIYHYQKLDWGYNIMVVKKDGMAYAKAYIVYEEETCIYLSDLFVHKSIRKQGIGSKLQAIREEIGSKLGLRESALWVKRETERIRTYAKRGYEYSKDYDENFVWMRKQLLK